MDISITAIDSTLIKAKGHVWHKSSIEKGIVPRSGIDTDARWWGYNHTNRRWVFGYKLHLTSTTATAGKEIIVPLTADVTTANVQDNQMYVPLTSYHSPFSVLSLPLVCYMVADPGYDDKKLYRYSKGLGIDLVCPVERYESNPKERLEILCFHSVLGQTIYSQRRISIEPSLIEHIKSVFRIDPLPLRGFNSVSAIVLLSVLLYQIMVYYNCKTATMNPKSIKYMLGTG